MSDNTYETYVTDDGQYRIRIEPDMYASSETAREGSNVSTIVSTHDRYNFGDREIHYDEKEALERGGWPLLKRYLQLSKHAIAITLIGMYDHSGITIYPMSEPDAFVGVDTAWDHSTAGFAYVTKADFEECSGGDPDRMTDVTLGLARFAGSTLLRGRDDAPGGQMAVKLQNMYAELKDLDDCLTGNVYGYVIEKSETWRKDGSDEERDDWEEIESCWGFIGEPDYCMTEAKSVLGAIRASEKVEVPA